MTIEAGQTYAGGPHDTRRHVCSVESGTVHYLEGRLYEPGSCSLAMFMAWEAESAIPPGHPAYYPLAGRETDA